MQVLPAARQALALLHDPVTLEQRFPFVFMTNGGGDLESSRAASLSLDLSIPVASDQVLLSHTPFRGLAGELKDDTVLVVGRGASLHVARSYGFARAVSTLQLAAAAGGASVPFSSIPTVPSVEQLNGLPCPVSVRFLDAAHSDSVVSEKDSTAPGTGSVRSMHVLMQEWGAGTEKAPVRAVLLFTDPADWFCDLQLTCDVLAGAGVLGRRAQHVPPESEPVKLFVSQRDLLWSNTFPVPRFGLGAFVACLETLLTKLPVHKAPEVATLGKPTTVPYRAAEELLLQQAHRLGALRAVCTPLIAVHGATRRHMLSVIHSPALHLNVRTSAGLPALGEIMMIGDNPASDIAGASAAGAPWASTLVRTGVFQGESRDAAHVADALVQDVHAAVRATLHRNRSARWHAQR